MVMDELKAELKNVIFTIFENYGVDLVVETVYFKDNTIYRILRRHKTKFLWFTKTEFESEKNHLGNVLNFTSIPEVFVYLRLMYSEPEGFLLKKERLYD